MSAVSAFPCRRGAPALAHLAVPPQHRLQRVHVLAVRAGKSRTQHCRCSVRAGRRHGPACGSGSSTWRSVAGTAESRGPCACPSPQGTFPCCSLLPSLGGNAPCAAPRCRPSPLPPGLPGAILRAPGLGLTVLTQRP